MGKISPPSIKYVIKLKFNAEGVVEKPDVIGAIFGQTEGLLGEELELRDLQKKGKIGRIEADLKVVESKTTGIVEIPTSIDKTETTIIAAAVETIDRIGPCDAKFEAINIDDVRSSKREFIVERAKKLMEKLSSSMPEMREIEQNVTNYSKTSKIREYGKEMLPAGPDIENSDEIIVVEGRADVLNLLRCNIKNTIAMNGNVIPQTIKELSKEKEITLFIDGDRGGILIAHDVLDNANVKFVARAPDGKEVEELVEKEILNCLRNRLKANDFANKFFNKEKTGKLEKEKTEKIELNDDVKKIFKNYMNEVEGNKNALILSYNGKNFQVIKDVTMNGLVKFLYSLKKRNKTISAIVMNGTVTQTIANAAEKLDCQYIMAKNFTTTSTNIKMLSF